MNEETKKKKNNWGGNKVACPFGFMSKVWKQCHGKSVKNIRNMFIFTGLDLRKLKIQIKIMRIIKRFIFNHFIRIKFLWI